MSNRPTFPDHHSPVNKFDRNIRLLIAMQGLRMLNMVDPIYGPFFLANGLPKGDLFLLQSVVAVVMVLWEIPSGYLADRWGRRRCIVLGDTFYVAAMLIFVFGHSFLPFCVAQAFLALGAGLVSGADTALLYDTLDVKDKVKEYQTLESRGIFRGRMGEAIGSLIASCFLFLGIPRWAFVASALRGLLLFSLSLMLIEPPMTETKVTNHLAHFCEAWHTTLVKNTVVRWVILIAAITVGVSITAFWLVQTLFLERLPHHQGWLPLLLLASYLCGGAFMTSILPRVPRRHSFSYLLGSLLFLSLIHLGMGILTSVWVLLGTILFQISWTCLPIIIRREINDRTPSVHRATTMSWMSLLIRLVQVGLMLMVSVLVNRDGAGAGFMLTTGVLIVAVIVGGLTRSRRCGMCRTSDGRGNRR